MERTEAEHLLARLQHGRSRYVVRCPDALEDLEARVHETASWCATFLEPEAIVTSLRPPRLTPRLLARNRWEAVDDVVAARRWALHDREPVGHRGYPGRLLVYFPDADLADGAAEAESEGFFDAHNAPPPATWIGYFEDGSDDPDRSAYLLAWVPRDAVIMAEAGMAVNPEECIQWVGATQVLLRPVLAHVWLHTQPRELR